MYDLFNTFVTGNGIINQGGYVCVRSLDSAPKELRQEVPGTEGLAVWHPGLMTFGKTGGFKAEVTKSGHLLIRNAKGHFHTTLRNDEAMVVEVFPGFIARNGYVGYTNGEFRESFETIVATWESGVCGALDTANKGQNPSCVDNSPFTQVLGSFSIHQRVIKLEPSLPSEGECAMVFDLSGNRLASKTHYPLRLSKWRPDSEGAKFSHSTEWTVTAA